VRREKGEGKRGGKGVWGFNPLPWREGNIRGGGVNIRALEIRTLENGNWNIHKLVVNGTCLISNI